ncbi:MAG TPA: sigma factor [Micropepsaceae bacterium]|nr:sigma factor [Micropepsaceae bacterium]
MPREGDQNAWQAAENVARHSYGKLVAFLAAQTGDVARAEDALSEAFASALADWPLHGAPQNPEGWLMAVAKRKIIDMVRRRKSSEKATGHLRLLSEEIEAAADAGSEIPDDLSL